MVLPSSLVCSFSRGGLGCFQMRASTSAHDVLQLILPTRSSLSQSKRARGLPNSPKGIGLIGLHLRDPFHPPYPAHVEACAFPKRAPPYKAPPYKWSFPACVSSLEEQPESVQTCARCFFFSSC